MKHIIAILLLAFLSCKNESKPEAEKETQSETQIETETETDNKVNKSVSEMWNSYIESNPESEDKEIPESDFFHNNREDANRLAELTLTGKKKAATSLFSLYEQYGIELPKVGTKQIVTDFDGI